MLFVRFIPIVSSLLLLGAHFSRSGLSVLILVCIGLIVLLFMKKAWAARIVQIGLVLGSIEWIRIMFVYIEQRKSIGESWERLMIILLLVALFTLFSAMLFQSHKMKKRYHLK